MRRAGKDFPSTSGANALAAQVKTAGAWHSLSRGPSASSVVASTLSLLDISRVGLSVRQILASEPNPELPKPVTGETRRKGERTRGYQGTRTPRLWSTRTRCQPTLAFALVVLRPVYCSDRPLNFLPFRSPPQARNKLMEEHIESVGADSRVECC